MKSIYELELNERINRDYVNQTYVIRVPGGWIYQFYSENTSISTVFVPYSDDFLHNIIAAKLKETGQL